MPLHKWSGTLASVNVKVCHEQVASR